MIQNETSQIQKGHHTIQPPGSWDRQISLRQKVELRFQRLWNGWGIHCLMGRVSVWDDGRVLETVVVMSAQSGNVLDLTLTWFKRAPLRVK